LNYPVTSIHNWIPSGYNKYPQGIPTSDKVRQHQFMSFKHHKHKDTVV
jgi:hypothetical protein